MTYPDHVRQEARVLMFQGYSSDRVHKELRELYGDDVPDPSTIRAWRAESTEISTEERQLIEDNERRLALRFDALLDRKLDAAEKNLDKVRIPELVMGAGVYRDKPIRRTEGGQGIVMIQVGNSPPVPEAEVLAAIKEYAATIEPGSRRLLAPARLSPQGNDAQQS